MAELLEVVADAVSGVGGTVSLHVGAFPADDGESVYVVVPHEYFVLTPRDQLPPPALLARTVGFCVEHPGTATFGTTVAWVACLGAAVDINRDSTEELRRRGFPARRFVLGYSRLWDRWHGNAAADRPVDITYLGTTDVRRDFFLGGQARALSEWRTQLLIPPHEQMTRSRPDFLMGAAKHEHLARSRVLLNLHRGGAHALEWVRVLEAMVNGCVVVSEHSTDIAPLEPGVHVAFARPHGVVDVAAALLRHPDRLAAMRDAAYALCREELSMRDSAGELVEIATALLRRAPPTPAPPLPPVPEPHPVPETYQPKLAPWAVSVPVAARQALAAALASRSVDVDAVVDERLTGNPAGDGRVVDAVMVGTGDSLARGLTLASLGRQDLEVRVLIGTDPAAPAASVKRGPVRNGLLRKGSNDLVLVIEPGQELFPRALRTMVDALDADPSAAAAYPMVADLSAGMLWNSLPPEAERLQIFVYLGAPLLIRRDVLERVGGFSEDPAVEGFEDHDLWIRLVAAGFRGVLVPEILASGARTRPPPYGIAGLVPEVTIEALRRAADGPPPAVGV